MTPVEEEANPSEFAVTTPPSVLDGLFRPDARRDPHLDLRDRVDDELVIRHDATLRLPSKELRCPSAATADGEAGATTPDPSMVTPCRSAASRATTQLVPHGSAPGAEEAERLLAERAVGEEEPHRIRIGISRVGAAPHELEACTLGRAT